MNGITEARAELDADALRDPISKMQVWLLRERILDAEGINALERRVDHGGAGSFRQGDPGGISGCGVRS